MVSGKEVCLNQFAEEASKYYKRYKDGRFYKGRWTRSGEYIEGYWELIERLSTKARCGNGLDKCDLLAILKWGRDERPRACLDMNAAEVVRERTRKADADPNPKDALSEVTRLHSWSITYGSKTLMFMDPENHVALDRKNMAPNLRKLIGSFRDAKSQARSYVKLLDACRWIQRELKANRIPPPQHGPNFPKDSKGHWLLADIQQGIFQYTQEGNCIVSCSNIDASSE